MIKKNIKVEYTEVDQEEGLSKEDINLINEAKQAAKTAYAPYSGFKVGAAVLLENGEIVKGSNQENAAYPSGICAERTAVYYAGSRYPDVPILKIAVTAFTNGSFVSMPIAPCGSCRQVLLEAQTRHNTPVKIIMHGACITRIVDDSVALLPFPFDKLM